MNVKKEFYYESKLKLNFDDYKAIWESPLSTDKIKNRFVKRNIKYFAIIPTIALYFSKYTIVTGIILSVILVTLFIIRIFDKRITVGGIKTIHKQNKLLEKELKYYFNEKGFGIEGENINAYISWNLLDTWQIRGNWLIIKSVGIPYMYFMKNELEDANLYEKIMGKVKSNGKQFY
ncbi:MAG: hypothetical protein JEY96_19670 [Bacteroidales bacterium]|nr:hypothetical protein [Bacteroidales bacterium]